ncbi:Hypothetical predicted protein [Lecanosticta acicola]|uniref:Uncharacterized protein n=1 Tax=Lecanosticta acicola TaxID=111012 RepID=A0AAI8YYT9_9PEZI|nr:Hypothetical predicted protein [Lecanosticta acicola]
MAQPVLVRTYSNKRGRPERASNDITGSDAHALPPVASYAFADILRAADSSELQNAIDGIAEICAKNRMSLADEYSSHLPPLGEITESTSSRIRPHLHVPGRGMRRALTSVPEASSGSSEGSRKSKTRGSIFSFRKQQVQKSKPMRRMCLGMNRTIPVGTTTALAAEALSLPDHTRHSSESTIVPVGRGGSASIPPAPSAAASSLQRLLSADRASHGG